jgi:hypothetical protein
MRKLHCLLVLALSGTSVAAAALPLDTGYNHGTFAPYLPGSTTDNYWIKIASYDPSLASVPVAPASIINGVTPVAGVGAQVLGPNPWAALGGTHISKKGYSLYRKCFCLLSTQGASLGFNVRGDDIIQVWLNSVQYTLAGPTVGNFWTGSLPVTSLPSNEGMFLKGRNCIYVLVEDYWGATHFSLSGQVTGPGVMPMAAEGVDMVFKPCHCPQPQTAGAAPGNESAMIASIQQAARIRAAVKAAPSSQADPAPADSGGSREERPEQRD